MHIRGHDSPDDPSAADPNELTFSVPAWVIATKLGAAVVLLLLALVSTNRPQWVIGLLAAATVGAFGLRDVIARVRLRADAAGVVAVCGYAGHRRLPWSEIERVRVDARARLGSRSELLELDAGEEIFLYSRFDLGTDPEDAMKALERVRAR